MADLSPRMQKLVAAEKIARRPSADDHLRVFLALEATLGRSANLDSGPASSASSATDQSAAISTIRYSLI